LFSNKEELDNVEWQELSDSEYFEIRGFVKTQAGEMNMIEGRKFLICQDCSANNRERSSLCLECIDGSNYKSKTDDCEHCYCGKSSDCGNVGDYTHRDEKESSRRGKILMRALDLINGERQDTYGKPEDSFTLIAEYWNHFLESKGVILNSNIGAKEVAEMMMLLKIARMSGQKPRLDNYIDLVGYAAIAADMIKEEK